MESFFYFCRFIFPISARSMEYVLVSFGFFFPYSDFTGSFQCNLQERWENCDENAKRCINLIRSFNFVKLSSTIEANYHISWWRGWTVTYAIVRKIQFLLELQLNCSFAVWWNDFISLSDGMIFERNAVFNTCYAPDCMFHASPPHCYNSNARHKGYGTNGINFH